MYKQPYPFVMKTANLEIITSTDKAIHVQARDNAKPVWISRNIIVTPEVITVGEVCAIQVPEWWYNEHVLGNEKPKYYKTTSSGRGGRREGAGRPKGTGKWGEETTPMRVPNSEVKDVNKFLRQKQDEANRNCDYVWVPHAAVPRVMAEIEKHKQEVKMAIDNATAHFVKK